MKGGNKMNNELEYLRRWKVWASDYLLVSLFIVADISILAGLWILK